MKRGIIAVLLLALACSKPPTPQKLSVASKPDSAEICVKTFSRGALATSACNSLGVNVRVDTVVVTPPPAPTLSKVFLTPDSVNLAAGATVKFSTYGRMSNNDSVVVKPAYIATGGAIDSTGKYVAGSAAGNFKVVANVGTLADTSAVVVTVPAPVNTFAKIILMPDSLTLAGGTTAKFTVYGRMSNNDSVAVLTPTYIATGGLINTTGTYVAGVTAGTYSVIASYLGKADTSIVKVIVVPPPPIALGIPYGPFGLWATAIQRQPVGTDAFNLSVNSVSPGDIITRLNAARAIKNKLMVTMSSGHLPYLTNGVFDRAKWEARMQLFNTPAIKAAVALAVADGTLIGHSVMDEPNVHGLGDGNTWGPVGTMTKVRVDSLCQSAKNIFPTLPVGVVQDHAVFEPTKSYKVCEFIVDQYSVSDKDVTAFKNAGLALGARDNMGVLFSMNLLNGGTPAPNDGLWNCSAATGGKGTRIPNCKMSADNVRTFGLVLGPAGCGLAMWQYDLAFFSRPDNQLAFKDVAAKLATVPAKSCQRFK